MQAPRVVLISLILGTLAPASAILGQDAPPPGIWTTLAPAPTTRTEVAAAVLGGKIYVLGGFAEPSLSNLPSLTITNRVEVYDPATNAWTTRAPLPVGLHHAAAVVVGNRLYVIGGYTQSFLALWHPVATVYLYDPDKDAWTERSPMPTPRGALAVAESGGKLYAIGGYDGSSNKAEVEVYDPAGDTWIAKAPLPTPRDHLAAATVGVKIYAIGGRVNQSYARNLSTVEAYDPATDRWTKVADLPTARSGITAGVIHSTIYVLGGEAPEGTFRTNEAYTPETDRWHSAAPMPTGRHGLGSAVVGDRLYVISGGPKPGGSYSNVNEVFTPPGPKPAGRASAAQVGAVMALLATFEDAGVLPTENSPDANRLIKALIQFQAAFMKSNSPAVQLLLRDALAANSSEAAPAALDAFRTGGWTSRSLEAVMDYAAAVPVWTRPGVSEGFQAFNVGHTEFNLLAQTFTEARARFSATGRNIHEIYAARRKEMPGATQR
ncbi:MAG: Kelch repeat-containing protein [Nitrospiraceae bacterium]